MAKRQINSIKCNPGVRAGRAGFDSFPQIEVFLAPEQELELVEAEALQVFVLRLGPEVCPRMESYRSWHKDWSLELLTASRLAGAISERRARAEVKVRAFTAGAVVIFFGFIAAGHFNTLSLAAASNAFQSTLEFFRSGFRLRLNAGFAITVMLRMLVGWHATHAFFTPPLNFLLASQFIKKNIKYQ